MSIPSLARPSHKANFARCSLLLALGCMALAGCVTPEPQIEPRPIDTVAAPAPPTQVFVYPSGGQTAAQLDRDRYECHGWAVKNSGFDPSETSMAPHQRVQVVSMPPTGSNVPAGAITGAVLGAVASRPGNAGGGAVLGAVAGALIGAASDSSRQQEVSAVRHRYDQGETQANARLEQQADSYRRAIGACLEGRGYTVK